MIVIATETVLQYSDKNQLKSIETPVNPGRSMSFEMEQAATSFNTAVV